MSLALVALSLAIVGAAGVVGYSVAASYVPARRAARVDPMVALRTESPLEVSPSGRSQNRCGVIA